MAAWPPSLHVLLAIDDVMHWVGGRASRVAACPSFPPSAPFIAFPFFLLRPRGARLHSSLLSTYPLMLLCYCSQSARSRKKRLSDETPMGKDALGGKWLPEEDDRLRAGVEALGAKNWKRISEEFLDKKRTDVQCLHRWQKV